MKKTILLSLLFLSTTSIFAQDNRIRFGVKGGLNGSTVTGREIFDSNTPRISFHIGGVVEIPLNAKFSIQPELLYSRQGSRFGLVNEIRQGPNDLPFLFDVDFDFNYDYLTIPILFKYNISERFRAGVGPQIDYLLNAKSIDNFFEQIGEGSETEIDVKEGLNDFSVSMKASLTYELENGLFFEFAYSLSVTKINKFSGPLDNKNQRNSVFQLSTGYKF